MDNTQKIDLQLGFSALQIYCNVRVYRLENGNYMVQAETDEKRKCAFSVLNQCGATFQPTDDGFIVKNDQEAT